MSATDSAPDLAPPRARRAARDPRPRARPGPSHRAAPALAALIALAIATGCATTPAAEPTTAPPASPTATAAPATATPPPASPTAAPAFPLELTDAEANLVRIEAEPQRIVSLTPATTEILFAIGAGERVVATTDFDDYPPEAVDLPAVASYTAVDVEKIVGLETDLVIAGGNFFNDPDALQRLRDLGIPVYVVYAETLDAVLDDVRGVGRAVGLAEAGEALAASMAADFDAVAEATADLPRPRVFYELDATTAIYTAADGSFIVEMIERAGGEAITTGSPTDFAISLERLIDADPEVIVLGDAAYGVTAEQVAARPGWQVMTAVREGAIRPVDDLIVTRPGPRLPDGLRELAQAIHPDLAIDGAAAAAPTTP